MYILKVLIPIFLVVGNWYYSNIKIIFILVTVFLVFISLRYLYFRGKIYILIIILISSPSYGPSIASTLRY